MNILVIDDSPVQHKLAKFYLGTGFGHSVESASNGMEGIDRAILTKPDVILLDIDMPDLSGKDTLRALKKIRFTRNIPVIMTGTDSNLNSKDTLLAMGAADFIMKHIDMKTLNTRVTAAFNMSFQTA